ncbi:MAG: FtsX-like permease family protein, partial [Firmicutes bacterium]|nr:FtsX-like permease family protein [Bacillota bacterium]
LLKRPEFVDYWAYKWSDLLLVSSRKLQRRAMRAFYDWIRDAVATNKPWDQFAREILTATAKKRGAVGAVINGYHRDTPRVLEQNWPVFSRGRFAQDSSVRTQVVDYRCPIEIGGVWVEPGDLVWVALPRGRTEEEPRSHPVRVAGFVWEPIGTVAYLPADAVRRLFRRELALPHGAVSGIRIKADPRHRAAIRERLLGLPDAAAVTVLEDIERMMDNLMGTARRFITVMLLFGMALAFSITFTMVTINVLERSNEVATMRTVGVGRWTVLGIITMENLLTALLGVLLGLPLGRALVEGFFRAAQTEAQMELFSMKIVVRPGTYAVTALAIVAVVLLSQFPAMRQVNRLNLARATKERVT